MTGVNLEHFTKIKNKSSYLKNLSKTFLMSCNKKNFKFVTHLKLNLNGNRRHNLVNINLIKNIAYTYM